MNSSEPISQSSDSSSPQAPDITAPVQVAEADVSASDSALDSQLILMRQQPIPPPSEARQYRAIGLVRGQYIPSAEQFTRGQIITSDGTAIEAVLLGRVMSLVKKHLSLEEEHLWVTYPRTREKEGDLHIQIVGVWEPEKLHRTGSDLATPTEAPAADDTDEANPPVEVKDGYFSIRGEIVYQSPDNDRIIVKIRQAPRKDSDQEKAFKLLLRGTVTGKAVGYFWDLHVQRQASDLVIQSGTSIGIMPPKKKTAGGGGGLPRKRFDRGGRPGPARRSGDTPKPQPTRATGDKAAPTPPVRKEPLPKPVKRRELGN